ncbi:MAG: hypothetical protein HY370_02710 [Proteobacteria bacterium]|nr:hypothetical protein [Pseudomonadota bacterium]
MNAALSIDFAPILPPAALYALAAGIFLCLALSALFYRRALIVRAICAAIFFLAFMNPSLVEEQRRPVKDVVAIIVDRSPSQAYGERTEKTEKTLAYLKERLEKNPGIEMRIADNAAHATDEETILFEKADAILSDVPLNRRAGVIFLTDGQVHDVPRDKQRIVDYGPIHTVLSGERNEHDRQLEIREAPLYGIVGQQVAIRYRIADSGENPSGKYATVLLKQDNERPLMENVPVNQDMTFSVTIDHAGQNIFELEVSGDESEITLANNRVPLVINGVRDRMRVLLVSGQPHTGGRTWRDMLTSDPAVDLVHFTILREPNKLDATPQNELALIAFPFQELFETKLYDFDLIIFDQYRLNRILPNYYFGNIARYVRDGGALLEASGPSYITDESIYTTDLEQILPAHPAGQIVERPFKPLLTEKGRRHPVTRDLRWPGEKDGVPGWGSWLRQVSVAPKSGYTLMSGFDDLPLLMLDHVGKGRVAQLASDQIWLWYRGYEGGGPQAELLRRLAHWLMKEPELEENALDARIAGGMLEISRRSLADQTMSVTVTAPDSSTQTIELQPGSDGSLEASLPVTQTGVYTVSDGSQTRFAISGSLNPREMQGVITATEKMAPVAQASGGAIIWAADAPHPGLRFLPPGRNYGGRDWLGLRRNGSYDVAGIKMIPFFPEWLYVIVLLALAAGAWWHEGRKPKGR